MILEAVFSIALFVNGGHVIDTKFKLHHYSNEDYKEIFYLEKSLDSFPILYMLHCNPITIFTATSNIKYITGQSLFWYFFQHVYIWLNVLHLVIYCSS